MNINVRFFPEMLASAHLTYLASNEPTPTFMEKIDIYIRRSVLIDTVTSSLPFCKSFYCASLPLMEQILNMSRMKINSD